MEESTQEPLLSLNVDNDAGNILKETARWAKFISIVGIIGVVLMALALALAGTYLITLYSQMFPIIEGFAGAFIFLAFILVAILGFLVYLLYRFSTLIKKGIETQDQIVFNSGLQALKIYFIISGVFAILSLLGNFSKLF
ncbi:MAG TPA: hypothetical protein VNV85_11170 [Puia sp.]|jgi:hypothetical protein|nr:hypothetical protein [Puia sp.]